MFCTVTPEINYMLYMKMPSSPYQDSREEDFFKMDYFFSLLQVDSFASLFFFF